MRANVNFDRSNSKRQAVSNTVGATYSFQCRKYALGYAQMHMEDMTIEAYSNMIVDCFNPRSAIANQFKVAYECHGDPFKELDCVYCGVVFYTATEWTRKEQIVAAWERTFGATQKRA